MNKLSWQYIYNLFVQAAEDVPEWAPEWVRKHPHFEQYKSLEDVVKSFPTKYYRYPIKIEEGAIAEIKNSVDEKAKQLIRAATNGIVATLINIANFLERDNVNAIDVALYTINNNIPYYEIRIKEKMGQKEKFEKLILTIKSIDSGKELIEICKKFIMLDEKLDDYEENVIKIDEEIDELENNIISSEYAIKSWRGKKENAEKLKKDFPSISDEKGYNSLMKSESAYSLFYQHDKLHNTDWVRNIKKSNPFDESGKVTQEYKNKINEYLNFLIEKINKLINNFTDNIKKNKLLIDEKNNQKNNYLKSPELKKELIYICENQILEFDTEINKYNQLLIDNKNLSSKYKERLSTYNAEDNLFHKNKTIFRKALKSVAQEIREFGSGGMQEIYFKNINSPEPKYDLNSFFKLPHLFKMIFEVQTPVGIKNKTFNFPAETTLNVFCKNIADIIRKYFSSVVIAYPGLFEILDNISKLEDVKEMRDYISIYSQQYKKDLENNFEIVFSAKASDVLTMSTRSLWTSCQNFLNNETFSKKAISSAISKYVGIIYATNKQDFRKRGEQMIARSVVFLLKDSNSDSFALYVGPAYPTDSAISDYFTEVFAKSVVDNFSNIKVYTTTPPRNYYFPIENNLEPYFDDVNIKKKKI